MTAASRTSPFRSIAPAVADLHPSHLQLVMPVLQRETIRRLQACTRLGPRLAALLPQATTLPEGPPEAVDTLALLPRHAVEEAGARMGAIIYGRQLARYVDAPSVAVLERAMGSPARLFGIREAARGRIALPSVPVEQTPSDLAGAVIEAAWSCLARWRDMVSDAYRPWALLRLPAAGLPTPAPATHDGVILAVVAALGGAQEETRDGTLAADV